MGKWLQGLKVYLDQKLETQTVEFNDGSDTTTNTFYTLSSLRPYTKYHVKVPAFPASLLTRHPIIRPHSRWA